MSITFNEEKYYLSKRGNKKYYVTNKGKLLHREIWRLINGEIPDGYVIHHIDGDSLNNNISNLTCLSNEEHSRHHGETTEYTFPQRTNNWNKTDEGRKVISDSVKKAWKERKKQPLIKTCVCCGATFEAYYTRACYCSYRCRNKTWEDKHREELNERHRTKRKTGEWK